MERDVTARPLLLSQRMRRLATVFGLFAAGLLMLELHDGLRERRAEFPADTDVLYLPPPGQLELMALGYREALADLVWIRAVVFAGDKAGGQNFEWITNYLEAILRLAPTFRRPYDWAGVTFVYTGEQQITRDMIDRAISMYRRGLERFPEDHELLFSLGMALYRDVQSVPGYSAQERTDAKAEGAELLRRAAAFGAPPLVQQLAATIVDEYASDELAVSFLETQLMQTRDAKYRRLLQKKLRELAGTHAAGRLQALRDEFVAARDKELPYVSEALYALLRSQPAPSH